MADQDAGGGDNEDRLKSLFDEPDAADGPLGDSQERRTIFAALDSFYQYRKNAHYNTTHRRRQNLYALPSNQWQLLAAPPFSILDTLTAVDDAIDHNADLADNIFILGIASFGLEETPAPDSPLNWRSHAKPDDMAKAHSTIRQFYRDWTQQGFNLEVRPLLDTILNDLSTHLPGPTYLSPSHDGGDSSSSSILLPGAGLGRILFELCRRGYNTTGNEISYHQLLSSNFILNATLHADQYTIYPFATTFTNNTSRQNQLSCHTVPDTHPGQILRDLSATGHTIGEMNMTAGDFVLSYSGPDTAGSFDAVVSVFFVDTAPNLIRYIATVRNCLRDGGVWINIGPLLWHFDDRAQKGPSAQENEDNDSEQDQDNPENEVNANEQNHDQQQQQQQQQQQNDLASLQAQMPKQTDQQTPAGHDSHSHQQTHSEQPVTSSTSPSTSTSTSTSTNPQGHAHAHTTQTQPPSQNLDDQDEDKGIAEPGSFELSDEEVIQLLSRLGFRVVKHEILDNAGTGYGYMQDPTSLLQNRYRCSHWVARKC